MLPLFESPLFLAAGMAAGAIPIAIHLINRRHARLLPIATLRFLRCIPARTMRRRRLEEYLLLIARMLVFLILGAAAAQPSWPSGEAGNGPTGVVVVLDDSYSMSYRVSGVSRFQRAQEAAHKVFRSLKQGDEAALVLASTPGEGELVTGKIKELTQDVADARCETSARSLEAAMRKALGLLQETKKSNRELIVITDLQRRALPGSEDEVEGAGLSLVAGIRPVVVDVGAEDPVNLSVTRVEASTRLADEPVRVTVRVENRATADAESRVRLVFGRKPRAPQPVRLPPASGCDIQLSALVETAGETSEEAVGEAARGAVGDLSGRVVLEGDGLAADDERHFVVPAVVRISVLLVNGDPSPIAFQDETFFLEAALAPERFEVQSVESPMDVDVVEEAEFASKDLSAYHAVVLANVRLDDDAGLTSFVRNGGGLLIFGGNRVDADALNLALGTDPDVGLLPAPLLPPSRKAPDEDLVPLTAWAEGHPIFAGLSAGARRDLNRIHVRDALGVDAESDSEKVLASLADGRPFLLERTLGRGKILLVTTSADADWGNFPIRPIFLPLLHRSVRYVAEGGKAADGYLVGQEVRIPAPPSGKTRPGVLGPGAGPNEEPERLNEPPGPDGCVSFFPPPRPGIYRVTDSGAGRDYLFALNVDPEEGDLTRAGDAEIARAFGGEKPRILRDLEELQDALIRSREGQPLWAWFLGAALLLLLFEGIFANRIAMARSQRDAKQGRKTP